MDAPTIRKQIYELVPADLEQFPIWEQAIDEEGEEGQDEATMKPRPDLDVGDPDEGLLVIRAELVAADGTRFDGYVAPSHEPEIGYLQPTAVTDRGQVNFWLGGFGPREGQLERAYELLGKTAEQLFPVRYRALVPYKGARLEGELPAFLRMRSVSDATIVEVT
jgi:hypothetical protein